MTDWWSNNDSGLVLLRAYDEGARRGGSHARALVSWFECRVKSPRRETRLNHAVVVTGMKNPHVVTEEEEKLISIGRHPNTIAYPENFFESAQIIATHSHLRWPDLSREWIHRQQARIARVDWESKQPLILGPRKSRLNFFTRKQQKILKKAREMDGTPDLSALLKGKLQLLKKSTTEATSANPTGGDISQEVDRSYPIDQTVDPDPPGSKPKKKSQKKKKSKEAPFEGDAAPGGKVAIFEGSTDDSSLKKKKTKKTKRPHEDLDGHEGLDNDSSKDVSEENPKKKKKSKKEAPVKKAQQSPGFEEAPAAQGSPRVGEEAVVRDSQEKASSEGVLARTESPGGPRVLPVKEQGTFLHVSARPKAPLGRGRGSTSPITWSSYITSRLRWCATPVSVPSFLAKSEVALGRCLWLGIFSLKMTISTLHWRADGYASNPCTLDADGCMNVLVEKYDTALKQTMTELGASAKLAKVRLGVIERLRADQERISKKTLEEKEALKVKFEGLEAALRADRAAKKELAREKAALERVNAQLEKEKAELQAERDAVTRKLTEERQRLRDSRGQEVSRERVQVQSAMTDKLRRRLDSVRSYLAARDLFEKEKNLLGQASGTKKCLEMIREEKLEITQELIDVFVQQEAEHQAAVAKLDVGPLPEEALALSPLVLRSRFVNEEFMATLDPYGSNEDLVGSELASQLRTPQTLPEDASVGQPGEILAEATLPEEELGPRAGDDIVGEGRSSVQEDLPSDADPEKVIEVDDSSHDDNGEEKDGDAEEPQSLIPAKTGEPLREQEGLVLAEKSSLSASVEQEGPRGKNEDEMVLVDAPESQTAPEDGEAAKDPDVDLHTASTGDSPVAKEPST
ncbi:hypothetical protein Bca52824_001111 [Brassica carinata]|uniref:Uncharacterized protein n=1 Tax=Brassica carinata TaxID=52824 RepID=A0A8X7WHV7_BRACI|nr:hypothetical protein Bca52824_001111 [Brassica carinata]